MRRMQERNLEEVTPGHSQRVFIGYLETLSVTQLDMTGSSLTWTAFVSLSKNAFAVSVTADPAAPLSLIPVFFHVYILPRHEDFSPFLSSFPPPLSIAVSILAVIFFGNTTSLPFSLYVHDVVDSPVNLTSIQVSCISLRFDQTWLLSALGGTVWNCLLICLDSGKVRCEPPSVLRQTQGGFCVHMRQ